MAIRVAGRARFAIGLGVAWWAGWSAADLVWSLWLSSLVVGYAMIVWMIAQPAFAIGAGAWKTRNDPLVTPRTVAVFALIVLVVGSLMLGFFTVHFGGFHYVHSQFLLHFFPIDVPGAAQVGGADRSTYLEVFRRYWIFLPSAFLSHRAAFLRRSSIVDGTRWRESFVGASKNNRDYFLEPYRGVLRMHGLIFFFFLAHFARLEFRGLCGGLRRVPLSVAAGSVAFRCARAQISPLATQIVSHVTSRNHNS